MSLQTLPRNNWYFYLIVIASICVAYSNIYHNAFLYDDLTLIVKDQFLRNWNYIPTLFTNSLSAGYNGGGLYYRPLQALLYLIVFQFFGLSAAAYHALNLGLHIANACLLIVMGRKLNFHPMAVLIGTLLWALHPIHTETITYISATADALYTFFCLCGLIILLPDFTFRKIGIASLFLGLALLSKESAVVFPLLAGVLLYYVTPDRLNIRRYFKFWPLAIIVVAYTLTHYYLGTLQPRPAAGAIPPIGGGESLMPFATILTYVRLLVWPNNLYMEHNLYNSDSYWYLKVLGGFILLMASGIQITKRQPSSISPLSWGLLWFFAAHIPVFSFQNIVYEHWMYLPTIGLFLGLSQTAYSVLDKHGLLQKKSVLLAVAASTLSLSLISAYLTFQQNKIWATPVTFYNNIIKQGQPAPKALTNLGVYYATQGNYDAAITNYKLAILESGDTQAEAHNNIAITMLSMPTERQNKDEIRQNLLRAVELDPHFYSALKNLAQFYKNGGDEDEAKKYQARVDAIEHQYNMLPEPPPTQQVIP